MERIQINASNIPAFVLGAATGVAAGSGVAYLVLRRVFETRFNNRLDAEVAAIKDHYSQRNLRLADDSGHPYVGPPAMGDSADAVEHGPSIQDRMSREPSTDTVKVESLSPDDPRLEGLEAVLRPHLHDLVPGCLVLEDEDEEDGLAADAPEDITERGANGPYSISRMEFDEPPVGFQQITITYYAGDKVLVDERDQPIPDIIRTTGVLDPLGFGGVSGDPHIRFVRNEQLEADFEIILDRRSYLDAILNYGKPGKENI
jgi:hypothetical protein